MYLDSFLVNAHLDEQGVESAIQKLEQISGLFHVDFFINISLDEHELPESLKDKIVVSL